jgi:hypothetical protein
VGPPRSPSATEEVRRPARNDERPSPVSTRRARRPVPGGARNSGCRRSSHLDGTSPRRRVPSNARVRCDLRARRESSGAARGDSTSEFRRRVACRVRSLGVSRVAKPRTRPSSEESDESEHSIRRATRRVSTEDRSKMQRHAGDMKPAKRATCPHDGLPRLAHRRPEGQATTRPIRSNHHGPGRQHPLQRPRQIATAPGEWGHISRCAGNMSPAFRGVLLRAVVVVRRYASNASTAARIAVRRVASERQRA